MVADQRRCTILSLKPLLLTVNIDRGSSVLKKMFNQRTSRPLKNRPFSCTDFASVEEDLLNASDVLQSGLLSALYV